MNQRVFLTSCVSVAVVAFFGFRSITGPDPLTASPLQLFLIAGFVMSALLVAYGFTLSSRYLRSCWLRLAAVPVVLVAFILLSGVGVFTATALGAGLLRLRGYDLEAQEFQYADSSGMQMTKLDAGLWFHVIYGVIPALLLLTIIVASAAFTGINATKTSTHIA
jgi:hypothetical protein